ncbi:MAG: hypothetical protein VX519_12055 [Myxococcota bacterium]|nr:hypothetical protein [Myxococcota bacterium]
MDRVSRNQPFPVKLQVRAGARDLERLPLGREALVQTLFTQLESAIAKGMPRPTCLALGPESVLQYDLQPLVREGSDLHRFVASVAGGDDVETVGIVGVLQSRRGKVPGAFAVVFVGESDGRWWHAWKPVFQGQETLLGAQRYASAELGDPRPPGLGGWWARSRSQDLRLRVDHLGGTIH